MNIALLERGTVERSSQRWGEEMVSGWGGHKLEGRRSFPDTRPTIIHHLFGCVRLLSAMMELSRRKRRKLCTEFPYMDVGNGIHIRLAYQYLQQCWKKMIKRDKIRFNEIPNSVSKLRIRNIMRLLLTPAAEELTPPARPLSGQEVEFWMWV